MDIRLFLTVHQPVDNNHVMLEIIDPKLIGNALGHITQNPPAVASVGDWHGSPRPITRNELMVMLSAATRIPHAGDEAGPRTGEPADNDGSTA